MKATSLVLFTFLTLTSGIRYQIPSTPSATGKLPGNVQPKMFLKDEDGDDDGGLHKDAYALAPDPCDGTCNKNKCYKKCKAC